MSQSAHGNPQVAATLTLTGLPGASERVTVIPQFSGGPVGPDAPGGAPGKYEVTLLFVRPSKPLASHVISLDPGGVERDSLIQWLAEPPPGAADFHIKLAVHIDSRFVEVHLRTNRGGFLARADTSPFEAASLDDAENTAYRAIAPALSHWSAQLDIPIQIGRIYVHELATEARRASIDLPFPEVKFSPAHQGSAGVEYRLYASLYREGLTSNRPAYQFMCFYKILEGISARRKRIDAGKIAAGNKPFRESERLPTNYADVPAWLDSLFLTRRTWDEYSLKQIVPPEALGKKVSALHDTFRTIRNEIAHVLTDDREPTPVIDQHFESPTLQKWIALMRCVARLVMRNEFPVEFALGVPPAPSASPTR